MHPAAFSRTGISISNGGRSAGARGKVLGRDLVEELLELVDDLLRVLDLVLELDRALLDHFLRGEDRRRGTDRDGKRIGGTRVDLDLLSVYAKGDRGVERVVLQLRDRDARALSVELVDHLADQVVGHRAGRRGPLKLHENRGRLRVTDPDRQEFI